MMIVERSNQTKYLYVHVPFCRSICFYCDFCRFVYQDAMVQDWLEALAVELHAKQIDTNLKTIYIGGGTPTALNENQLDTLLSFFDNYVKDIEEYTIEVNPDTLTKEKVNILKKHHVNRISLGVQTTNPQLLQSIGRRHTLEDVKNAVNLLKAVGIDNLSFDLMYGLPNQSVQDVKDSIDTLVQLEPKHLSVYALTIEENSVFGKRGITPIDTDIEADMYECMETALEGYGYRHYEVSNFAKERYESKHNMAYWLDEDFIGLGCGASGREHGYRYDHTIYLNTYIDEPLFIEEIPLSKEERIFEAIMMGLRIKKGISISHLEKKYQFDFKEKYHTVLEKLMNQQLLEIDGDILRCSEEGYPILHDILVEFME